MVNTYLTIQHFPNENKVNVQRKFSITKEPLTISPLDSLGTVKLRFTHIFVRTENTMTIICPACDARFREPPAEILKSRPLQCGKCEHEWVANAAPRISLNSPNLAPDMADLIEAENAITTALPVLMPSEAANTEKHQPIYVDREPEIHGKNKLATIVRSIMPMATMACVALFAGTVIFKDAIMAELPRATAIYQAAGLTTSNPNLEIANVVTTKSTKDGIRQLIIRGEVQNIADNTVPVPPLKLIMRGKHNANLFAWTVTTAKTSLKAGEKSHFTAVAHDFPLDAVNVEVEFSQPAKH